ncbi:MAG: hypothetical protein CBD58_00155 [bacterium TMED198]|nr:MAG: hypothetical protein CBD58_00155 [bacterium TMED198]
MIVGELVNEGIISKIRGGKYMINTGIDLIDGIVSLTLRGSGFLEDRNQSRIFISKRGMNSAVAGDKVRVRVISKDVDRAKGKVEKILSRNTSSIPGKIEKYKGKHILHTLTPFSNRKIYISNFSRMYKVGSIVKCKIIDWGNKGSPIFVEIEKIISIDGNPKDDIVLITEKYSLPNEHSVECINSAEKMINIPVPNKEFRTDYSNLFTLAIDPKEARDHDDAISLEKTDKGWLAIVHISDVTAYVKEGDFIDVEAKKRGNSIYFPDDHIPMLPLSITQKLCSLTMENSKAAISVEMDLNSHCQLISYRFNRSLVKVDECLSYSKASSIIEQKDSSLYELMNNLDIVTKKLMENRIKSGSLSLSSSDIEIKIDKTGNPVSIKKRKSLDSHRIVEELMLLANVCAANFISPSSPLYRIHEKPDDKDILNLISISKHYDRKNVKLIKINKKNAMKDLLSMYKETSMEFMINNLCLRAMPKAVYSTREVGHYALSFERYTHFTSPIRRYSDVVVHRIIKSILDKSRILPYQTKQIGSIASHCTATEILAVKAEREYIKIKQLRYISGKIGKIYTGIVSGLIERGLFVYIDKVCIDGFTSYDYMDDYYIFDERKMISIGRKYKNKYYIGKQVKVEIVHVNINKRMLDIKIL